MKNKKILIIPISLILAAAIVAGIVFLSSRSQETVGVYPFTMVGMDGYWGDSQESYGPVSTDKIQTVFLSDTQEVTEVLVAQGDAVKKGDILLTFDTTLSGLQLERKRLEVEKLKLQLDAAKAELKKLLALKPMEVPQGGEWYKETVFLGGTLSGDYKPYLIAGHDGKTMGSAFVCWLKDTTYVDDALLEDLRKLVWSDSGLCQHGYSLAKCHICNCTHGTDCELCNNCVHDVVKAACKICSPQICQHNQIQDFCPECPCPHGISRRLDCSVCNPKVCPHNLILPLCPQCSPKCPHDCPPGYCNECYCIHGILKTETCSQCAAQSSQQIIVDPVNATGQGYRIQLLSNTTTASSDSYYVIFKVTDGNTELGAPIAWQGAHIQGKGEGFSINYFTPLTSDYTLPEMDDTSVSLPEMDPGSGFTAAQLAQLRSDQEQKIKDLTLKHKMAAAEYKIMENETGDGTIRAEFDGTVVSLLSQEEAKNQKQPMVKVSGGGGFFIAGSVSELEKDNLKVGQEVTVNDWSSGGVYTGTVKEIGDFPSIDGYWNGSGNPNTTYYPFTVFVGEEASLQAGAYANIQYSTSDTAAGIYLDKAFLRTEDGRSFVFVRSATNTLEKRYVTTGKSLWGSYVEIKAGLTVEDYIAFPYGKDVKEGAPAEEKDIAELYGY